MQHRRFLLFIALFGYALAGTPNNALIDGENFQADAALAKTKQQAIIVMFSADHCSFCQTLKEEVLQPMQIVQKDSDYMIRHIEVDSIDNITNFDGSLTTMTDFSRKHRVYVTPTLLFFDEQGKEAAPRIIGVNTVEMLSYYVESSATLISKNISARKKFSQHYE